MADESLRDSISAAFEKQETPVEPVQEAAPPAVETPAIEDKTSDKISDNDSVDSSGPDSGKQAGSDNGALEKSKTDNPSTAPTVTDVPVPVSLNAQEKAEWAKAPKAIQQAYLRREEHTQKVLRESAESRKLTDEFNQVIGPYMPLIRASQSTPMVAVKNLMTTAAGLTLGTPQQKAQIIRDIIQNYQVDLKVLDDVLSNNLPNGKGAPGTSDIEVHVQKAVAPIYEFMGTLQQQRAAMQQRTAQEAEQAVERFRAQNEFFEEVREEMADYMEVATNRGKEMTMQQAYNLAVENNPTIKAAIAQKKAAGGNGAAERAQRAALSVSGAPRNPPVKDKSQNSLRDDLMEAMNQAQGL